MRKNVTRKQQLQNSKRRNELIVISFVAMVIITASILGIVLQQKNTIRNDSNTEEASVELELNIGIAKAFENYMNSNATSEDVASIQANKIVNKKMAQIEETSEVPTEMATEPQTEVQTETSTEITTEAPTEVQTEAAYSEDELYWLSHVIAAEVGNSTYESKAMCGLVVINRVNSSSFRAETIEEVIFSPGQYETVSNGKIYEEPDEESVEVARKILEGTIEIQIPYNVVYQAEFPQGSDVYRHIGYEYFCYDD